MRPGKYQWDPSDADSEEWRTASAVGHRMRTHARTSDGHYTCPRCWITSHSSGDAKELYCAACHGSEFDATVQIELARMRRMGPWARLIYRVQVIRNTWPGEGKTPWGHVLSRLSRGPFP